MTIPVGSNSLSLHNVRIPDIRHYINGRFKAGSEERTFQNINPYTKEIINTVSEGGSTEINEAVEAADRAFRQGPWGSMKLKKRLGYIHSLADLIEEEIEEIALLESIDTGLPISQTKNMAARAADNFRFYAKMVETKLHGEAYPVDNEFINYTVYSPLGVIGLITPWNAPFMLETWKVAPALATGNTVILKPAELSPLTANKLAELAERAGLPPGVFNVVHGYGEKAGAALVKHPLVKAISFTGETVTGSEIIRNSASTLKRTSMELGGKSPMIVFDDADLDRALDAAIWGIYSFNGERCTANSRLFLHKNIKDEFVKKLEERVQRVRIGDPMDQETELGPLISQNHFDKVNSYVQLAKEEGCRVIQGRVPDPFRNRNIMPPTLLLGARNDMTVCQEEIFGPVMAVIEFETEEEAIQMANDVMYGLAGFVWTNDMKRGHRVAQAVEAGMLWINAQNVRDLRIPFGGMKASGIGREGGHYAMFEFYTEAKVIHVSIADHHIPQFGKQE